MITSVLVANRGEIARRVFRTCRALGLGTVAVFSDPDAGSPHVLEADAAVRLPGAAPADTYLRADLVIDAARRAGADAVHPGYGFLAENAGFARAVLDAGLTWIGPAPGVIEAMGAKIGAKLLMSAAGVPVLEDLQPDAITEADLPVLVKASAGGGGRGMRIVRSLPELAGEIESARAEAAGAFGDPTVFCEPYLATGRHIEVQLMADQYGTVWTVGERECSIQRRHQKVIEEAPSPLVERIEGMRAELFTAARAAADAIGYTGAGTVEFLADETGRFFFLEMNTRLQVEHPVTECTTGLDLVALQISVADGIALGPHPPPVSGHAVEARLYAEDPAAGWQPQTGTLTRFEIPGDVRVDSGVEGGSVVGVHYDPMLAKVIAWAPDRATAVRSLATALARARIHGVLTNRELLVNVLRHPSFRAGDTDTAFFDTHGLDTLAAPIAGPGARRLSALAAALALDDAARSARVLLPGVPAGWRNVPSQPRRACFADLEISYRLERDGLRADSIDGVGSVSVLEATPTLVVLEVDGVRRAFDVAIDATAANARDSDVAAGDVHVDSPLGPVRLQRLARFTDPAAQVSAGSLLAPMPGTVARVAVRVGDEVRAGEPILWLEAMKMQHRIDAPVDGVLAELPVEQGQQIDVGAVLAVVAEKE